MDPLKSRGRFAQLQGPAKRQDFSQDLHNREGRAASELITSRTIQRAHTGVGVDPYQLRACAIDELVFKTLGVRKSVN